MAQEYNLICDGCGEIVHGKHKATVVSKDYVVFKGTLLLQVAATRDTPKDHYYLTKKYDGVPPELIFCRKPGLPCIEEFVSAKVVFVNSIRNNDLRAEATKEQFKSLDTSQSFVVGKKK